AKKKDKDKKKKSDKKKKDKKKGKKDKKKKKKASSSDSSSSDNKKAKKERKRKQEEDNAKNAWLATKMRELRKADANLTARDAMKMAEAEYEKIFSGVGVGEAAPAPAAAEGGEWGLPAAAEAAKEAEDEARKQGKSEEEIAKAGRDAGERVMRVAEEAGVYKAPKELPLFMQNRLKQQSEAARLAAMPAPVAGENSRPAEMQEPRRLALKLPPDTKDKKKKR
ncbi:unnamed protein product, partial [Symbiodinium pilosum]